MYLVLLGPPGAGKGTQAAALSREFKLAHISTGDMLRVAVREKTDLGLKAQEFMDRGDLVPDDLVIAMMRRRLQANDARDGFVLDGFPRNVSQAEGLDAILAELDMPLELVINLEVPESELVRRMTGRRVCPNCGASYHLVFNPPKSLGVCDQCGEDLVQSDDYKEATVRARLEVYERENAPLVKYYQDAGLLVQIDGLGTVDQVYERIRGELK
ncbi:MAG: adenylate kinase [Bacillota bacterium]